MDIKAILTVQRLYICIYEYMGNERSKRKGTEKII